MTGLQLWQEFRDAFLSAVARLGPSEVQRIRDPAERTLFYGLGKRGLSGLLPQLAHQLGMERFDQEYLGADGVFVANGGWPMIYVESENVAGLAWQEIERLCYLRAPLKVLITAAPWPAKDLTDRWKSDIRRSYAWVSESPNTVYGFLVLDLNKPDATYVHFAVGSDGETIAD
jgi:hypothetical protein